MKKVLLLSLLILSTSSLANCLSSVAYQYDIPARVDIQFDQVLKAGEIFEIYRMDDVGPFTTDKLVYVSKGSIHSGWFSDAIIVNPKTCKIDFIHEIAAE